MTTGDSDVRKTFGFQVERVIKRNLSEQRISFLPNVNVIDMKGDHELQSVHFNKEGQYGLGKAHTAVEFVIEPDMVICSNGIGQPKKELV